MRWLTLHIGGQRWAVELVSPKSKYLLVDGEPCDGVAHYDLCRICLRRDLPPQALEETLLHELLHATNRVTGASHVLDEAVPKRAYAVEEHWVRTLTPVLHRLLKDLGFRFPKGPSTDA